MYMYKMRIPIGNLGFRGISFSNICTLNTDEDCLLAPDSVKNATAA